jgi:hypothetical protein
MRLSSYARHWLQAVGGALATLAAMALVGALILLAGTW